MLVCKGWIYYTFVSYNQWVLWSNIHKDKSNFRFTAFTKCPVRVNTVLIESTFCRSEVYKSFVLILYFITSLSTLTRSCLLSCEGGGNVNIRWIWQFAEYKIANFHRVCGDVELAQIMWTEYCTSVCAWAVGNILCVPWLFIVYRT